MTTRATQQKNVSTPAQNPQQPVLAGVAFRPEKKVAEKTERPLCAHVYDSGKKKGQRCQLSPMTGSQLCSNHVAAESRLTQQEGQAILGWLKGLSDAELVVGYVRAVGWYQAKQQAMELATAPKSK